LQNGDDVVDHVGGEAVLPCVEAQDEHLAALLQQELLETVDRYGALKQRGGRLDFVDLLVRARDLIRGNETVPWLLWGDGIEPHPIDSVSVTLTAAAALRSLGLDIPANMNTGR